MAAVAVTAAAVISSGGVESSKPQLDATIAKVMKNPHKATSYKMMNFLRDSGCCLNPALNPHRDSSALDLGFLSVAVQNNSILFDQL